MYIAVHNNIPVGTLWKSRDAHVAPDALVRAGFLRKIQADNYGTMTAAPSTASFFTAIKASFA